MGRSSCCSPLCARPWHWLRLNSWWYYASFFPGHVPCTSNGWWGNKGTGFCTFWLDISLLPLCNIECYLFPVIKGTFLIAEVMASKGYKVQPLPRVQRHDIVQVCHIVLFLVLPEWLFIVYMISWYLRSTCVLKDDHGVAFVKLAPLEPSNNLLQRLLTSTF